MKKSIQGMLILCLLLLVVEGHAQDDNWTKFLAVFKDKTEALDKVTEAYNLIHGDEKLNLRMLPKATKINLASTSEAFFLEFLNVIEIYGEIAVFEKLEKLKPEDDGRRRQSCIYEFGRKRIDLVKTSFIKLKEFEVRNTANHLSVLQHELKAEYEFNACLKAKYSRVAGEN